MRCWQCKRLIVVPERPRGETDETLYPQTATVEIGCNSCGTMYAITTSRLPARMSMPDKSKISEAEMEEMLLWKREVG